MLRELHVRNLAVLATAAVELGPGFNVLSGETGAGKSIVVDSLALLAGVRASTDLIRTGAESLTVSGVFADLGPGWQRVRRVLEEAGLEAPADGEPEEVLIRREVSRSGRSRVFVNDQPTTLRLLADLAPHLLRIHGQRDELGLVDPGLQRVWLDRAGGAEAAGLLAAVAAAHGEVERLGARLERLAGDDRQRRERLDLLRYQAEEIDAARLQPGEEASLKSERDVLRHAEAIAHAVGTAAGLLSEEEGSAVERLARGRSLLEAVEEWEPGAREWRVELEELRIRTAELATALARRFDGLEADPARLDEVEQRLAVVDRLCRKYGGGVGGVGGGGGTIGGLAGTAEVLAQRREIAAELAELEGDSDDRDELVARHAEALVRYRDLALELSQKRAGWGRELVARIEAELTDLALGRARLEVLLERRRREGSPLVVDGEPLELGPTGIDAVVFLFAPNPGEEARPLARIASGGELSRIYLALQLAALARGSHGSADAGDETGEGETRPTLVFDEVDAGIGGAEAAALGSKLQRLARGGGQILAVTHLPQVASHGDLHFKVSKQVAEGRTSVAVEQLAARARVEEVARMLAGIEVTKLSLSHARELIDGARRR
jgi:DNA repair protein RecN (Recombination protein N)